MHKTDTQNIATTVLCLQTAILKVMNHQRAPMFFFDG
jgi:hypothetical protein